MFKKILKAVGWFLFVLLFVGNCILTVANYRNIRLNAKAGIYSTKAGIFVAQAGKTNRDMILTNQAIIKELLKKIAPNRGALQG